MTWSAGTKTRPPSPSTDSGPGGVSVNTQWDSTTAKVDAFLDSDPNTAGIQPTTLNDRVPVLLDVQVCFKYGTTEQCTWSQTPNTTIQRVPHAFGNGFPTAPAGPGQVALWTGEFNTETTDVSVPGYTGDLSISRSHSTYSAPTNNIDGAFGPGWVAEFDGAEAGAAGWRVIDSTSIDGTIALVDGDGTSLVYTSPTGKRRTTDVFDAGTWVPADEDTEVDGSKLTITGTTAAPVLSYIEDDGTVTTWNPAEATTPDEAHRCSGRSRSANRVSRQRRRTPTTPTAASCASSRRPDRASPAPRTTRRNR